MAKKKEPVEKIDKEKTSKDVNMRIIVDEIVGKVKDFNTRQSNFFKDYNDWSEIYTVKTPYRKKSLNTFSNPRLTEMHRAANALAGLEYSMIMSKDQPFEFVGMDSISRARPESISVATDTINTQLEKSDYNQNLLMALQMKKVFGTVVVEEPFDIALLSHLGRKLPMTRFEPKSMLQVSFDVHCTDIRRSSWLAISDIVDSSWIKNQYSKEKGKNFWIEKNVSDSLNDEVMKSCEIDGYIRMRLAAAGYNFVDWPPRVREIIRYYGKIDAINDGVEYIVFIVNRQLAIKFAANPVQTGRRPFRVAYDMKWELEPLGYGIGKLFTQLHRQMDGNRQKMQDLITMATYSMMMVNRYAGIESKDLTMRPWGMVMTDDIGNSMAPLQPNLNALAPSMTLEKMFQEEFRAASGATNTLQAIVTGATASETTLAQNEAIRNESIKTQFAGNCLLKEHIEFMHTNNMLYISEPFTILVNGEPRTVYPNDLLLDLDVKLKITTDKDFRPERLKKMLEAYQVLTSIRNTNPDIFKWDMSPLIENIVNALDVPANRMMVGISEGRMQELGMLTQMMQQFRQATSPNQTTETVEGEGLPAVAAENAAVPPGAEVVSVPAGEVLASPTMGTEGAQ